MHKLKIQNSSLYIGESYKNLDKYLQYQTILVTDENVYRYYKDFICCYEHIVIGCGEKIKTFETVSFIVSALLDKGADRKTFLVGFGGGIVTDITGFVASIFMRGISFGFIPTTLLSQVDASLGGKNGVNFQRYKNMLGVFNSPEFVICDATLLDTLPPKEVRSGFGEIIKHSLISDNVFFEFLKENSSDLLCLEKEKMEKVTYQAISIKAAIVEQDWKETGLRKLLNFGHTLGHAIENSSNLTHGEAVCVGMCWAAKWSEKKGLLKKTAYPKIKGLLEQFGLPTAFEFCLETAQKFIVKDKKKGGDGIDFVFLEKIGKAKVQKVKIVELVKELKS